MTSASIGISEEWTTIPGYEGFYEVSTLGRIRSLDRVTQASNRRLRRKGKILATPTDTHGYASCRLWGRDGVSNVWVHRSVLTAFKRPPLPDEEACHNNGDRSDNRLENLRWDTRTANVLDRTLHGTQLRGEKAPGAKLTEDAVRAIRLARGSYSNAEVAAMFGISRGYVAHIQAGRKWRHVA